MSGRVLVVDDNATQRRVLVRQLQRLGLEAACAGSANEALGILREAHAARRSFAAALVDHRMPGCDGAELSRTINSDPQLNSTRLVLLTFSGQAHEPFAAFGIAACLTKPVIRQDLIDCLHLVLAGSAQDWHAQTSPIITRKLLRAHRGRGKRHVLVAEDVPAGRKVMCRTLEHLGYRANGVVNGREAVTAWETGQYQLILMDCEMPELNGYDATRMIRGREPPGAHIPIIALTGHAMPGAELQCKQAGMDAYLSKPIDRERLESCLVRFLGESIDTTGTHPNLLAGNTDSDDKLVDLAALRVLADGDETFMREVISEFIRQGSTAISELGEAVARGDAVSLARTAHSLKTTAGELKAPALWRSVEHLETAVRQGAAEEYARLVEQVRHDVAHALEYVRRCSA
jgi:CheY-like chemotaxis protein